MARRRPDDRFRQILETAADVFTDLGYRRTQMADIAAATGLAKGTLYLYVESKEALFDAALRLVDAGPDRTPPPALPLPTPDPRSTLEYVRAELARQASLPALDAALSRRQVRSAAAELEAILGELHDVLARNRRRLKLLDRSARDYPELAALWFDGARGGLLAMLTAWIEDRRRRGFVAPDGDAAVLARMLVEAMAFWAVHRHWDKAPGLEPAPADDATVRDTVVAALVRSLVPDGSSARRSAGKAAKGKEEKP